MWDATDRRYCHLEFGFSCMGYEIPAALGVRLAVPDRSKRVLSFLGDGTFLMAPTELVTALQERLPVTVVISEYHGYQAIHRCRCGAADGSSAMSSVIATMCSLSVTETRKASRPGLRANTWGSILFRLPAA